MKNVIFLLFSLLLISCYSTKKNSNNNNNIIIDDWYILTSNKAIGYLNYNILKSDSIYKLSFNSKYKKKNDSIVFFNNSDIEYFNDNYLSVKSFIVRFNSGSTKSKEYYLTGYVNSTQNESKWIIEDAYRILKEKKEGRKVMIELTNVKKEFNVESPIIVDLNRLQFISKQNFNQKKIKIPFNEMSISKGPKYRKNIYLEYIGDELVQINEKSIHTKKIVFKGETIRGSTFWLDKNNKVVKFSMNNYTTFTLVPKNKIDLTMFN